MHNGNSEENKNTKKTTAMLRCFRELGRDIKRIIKYVLEAVRSGFPEPHNACRFPLGNRTHCFNVHPTLSRVCTAIIVWQLITNTTKLPHEFHTFNRVCLPVGVVWPRIIHRHGFLCTRDYGGKKKSKSMPHGVCSTLGV